MSMFLLLLSAATVCASESKIVDKSALMAVEDDGTETQTDNRKFFIFTSMTTTVDEAADGQHFTGATFPDDVSRARYVQEPDDGLSEVDEGRRMMERFYQRYSKTAQIDLVFVLDRSGSVPQNGWRSIVEFVKVG